MKAAGNTWCGVQRSRRLLSVFLVKTTVVGALGDRLVASGEHGFIRNQTEYEGPGSPITEYTHSIGKLLK